MDSPASSYPLRHLLLHRKSMAQINSSQAKLNSEPVEIIGGLNLLNLCQVKRMVRYLLIAPQVPGGSEFLSSTMILSS